MKMGIYFQICQRLSLSNIDAETHYCDKLHVFQPNELKKKLMMK